MAKKRANHEGSIFKDNRGFWIAEFVTADGKKKRKASKKKSVVMDWLHASLAKVRDGTYIDDTKITLGQFFDQFVEQVAKVTLRPRTIENYHWVAKHLPDLWDMRLSQLKPLHLQALNAKKLEEGLSKRSIIKIHEVTRHVLNHAVRFELIVKNPANFAQPPKPDDQPLVILSQEQIQKVLASQKGSRWYPIFCVAAGCGLREGEVLGLRKQDVLLSEGELKVEQTVGSIRGKLFIGSPKSVSSRRSVGLLPDFVSSALKEVWENAEENQLIFRTKNNTPISPRNLLRHFHQTLAELQIPRVPFHSLRHSYVSMLLSKNTPPRDVQALAGHSSFAITMKTYGHLMPGYQKTAARKLDGLV